MKKLALATALSMVSVAQAASNSALYDLQYLPEAGTVFGSTTLSAYRFSDTDYDTTVEKTRQKGNAIAQRVGYSPVNNLFVFAEASYLDNTVEQTGVDDYSMKGFNDFVFGGRYRLIDAGSRLDILGGFTFSPDNFITEKDGDMNNYSGGHSLNLGVEYGVKSDSHQWSVGATFVHYLKATLEDKEFNEKTKDDAHNGLNLSASMLTNFSEKFSFKNSIIAMFTEGYEDNGDGETLPSTNYLLEAKAQYLISKDLMLVAGPRAVLGGSGYNFTYMIYDLGLNYQF